MSTSASCSKWVYDDSVFADTIVTEWDLVCDRLPMLPAVASSYMAGVSGLILTSPNVTQRLQKLKMDVNCK